MHSKQARQAINGLMREVNLATEAIRSSASGIIRSIEQLPAEIGKWISHPEKDIRRCVY